MNAHKFVAKKGIDETKRVLDKYKDCYMPSVFKYWSEKMSDFVLAPKYASCKVSELKQVVESVEIVEHVGGIECANQILEAAPDSWCFACADLRKKEVVRSAPSHNDFVYIAALEKAISDYELVESYKENQHV
ncbi:hypothetical protein [Acinetobacter soli]|uniref:hypothetical protein n=1 Tax=Acinetobacter soli TaxID=487316 RepID=UPI000E6AD892|nr:hypothetical protein [Acinetobacter soli]